MPECFNTFGHPPFYTGFRFLTSLRFCSDYRFCFDSRQLFRSFHKTVQMTYILAESGLRIYHHVISALVHLLDFLIA